MASLLNADLSSDEEDDDYNPDLDPTKGKDENEIKQVKKVAGTKRGRAASGGAKADKRAKGSGETAGKDAEARDMEIEEAGPSSEESEEEEVLDYRTVARQAARRKRVDALWRMLNGAAPAPSAGGGGQGAPGTSGGNGDGEADQEEEEEEPMRTLAQNAVSLANLCHKTRYLPPVTKKRSKDCLDAMWMRTLGIAAPPKPPPTHALAEKILARQKGVAPAPATHSLPIAGSTEAHQGTSLTPGTGGADTEMADAAAALHPSSSGSHSSAESAEAAESAAVKRAMAAAAMAAAKEAASLGASKLYNKVMVTETRKFAGKDLQVTVAVDKDSKAAQKASEQAAAPAKSSGLDAILAEITKKKKVSVLDKSKMDWSTFKQSNTNVEEELEAYKKSSNQFLARQHFLKQAELREYEKERDARLGSDMRTRGRL